MAGERLKTVTANYTHYQVVDRLELNSIGLINITCRDICGVVIFFFKLSGFFSPFSTQDTPSIGLIGLIGFQADYIHPDGNLVLIYSNARWFCARLLLPSECSPTKSTSTL